MILKVCRSIFRGTPVERKDAAIALMRRLDELEIQYGPSNLDDALSVLYFDRAPAPPVIPLAAPLERLREHWRDRIDQSTARAVEQLWDFDK